MDRSDLPMGIFDGFMEYEPCECPPPKQLEQIQCGNGTDRIRCKVCKQEWWEACEKEDAKVEIELDAQDGFLG